MVEPLPIPNVDVDVDVDRCLAFNSAWAEFFIGALESLLCLAVWNGTEEEQQFAVTAVLKFLDMLAVGEDCDGAMAIPVGAVFAFPLAGAPEGFLACNGASYHKTEYAALWEYLGDDYEVDDDHFRVPDLRDYFHIGGGNLYAVGATGGASTVTLTASEIPQHRHTISVPGRTSTGGTPETDRLHGASTIGTTFNVTGNTGYVGSGSAHNNLPPYVAMFYAIYAGVA